MIIYLITNTLNGKKYVGQTIRTLQQRWSKHKSDSRTRNYPIYLAIRKYGKEVFELEILCTCSTQQELDAMEIQYIKLHNSVSPNGYNLELGGNGKGKQTPETCLKISKAKMGIKRESPSLVTREKMSAFAKNRIYTDETRVKMSKSAKNRKRCANHCGKNVIDITTGFVWGSVKEAANIYGINKHTLHDYLKGNCKNKTNLRYLDEVLDV